MTVKDGGVPQPGVRVLFQHPDGTFVTVMTDASGLAKADLATGGTVHVVRTFDGANPPRQDEIYSYLGVKPGDRLENGHPIAYGTPSTINVSVPNATGTVTVRTPCGSGQGAAPTVTVNVAGCPSTLSIYAEDDAQSSFYTKTAYAPNINLNTQLAMQPTSLSATGVASGTSVTAEVRIIDSGATLFSTGAQNVGTSVALPAIQNVEQLVIGKLSTANGTAMIAQRGTYTTTAKTVDGTSPVPYVSATTSTLSAITWTEQGAGTADSAVAIIEVTPATGEPYIRAIVGPHSGSMLPIPQLPGFDAYYNIAAADQTTVTHAIVAAPGGYDAFRSTVFTVKSPIEAAPASGTKLALSYSGQLPTLP